MAADTEQDTFYDELDAERARLESADAFKEDGRDIEAMTEDGVGEEEDDTVYIEGTTGQLSLSVGGRKPDASTLKLRAVEVNVDGQFTKGTTIAFKVIARVDEIRFTDKADEYGTVTASKRTHTARPVAVERLDIEE